MSLEKQTNPSGSRVVSSPCVLKYEVISCLYLAVSLFSMIRVTRNIAQDMKNAVVMITGGWGWVMDTLASNHSFLRLMLDQVLAN